MDPDQTPATYGAESAERLRRSVAKVRAWSAIPTTVPVVPAGSPLAHTDGKFPELPASVLAWHALASAVEHLTFGADIIDAGVAVSRANAFSTLLRSALAAASQALWMLHGDEGERAIRALLVVEDEAKHQRTFIDTLRRDDYLMGLADDPDYANELA